MKTQKTIILASSFPGDRHVGETYIQRVVTCLEPHVACIGVLDRAESDPVPGASHPGYRCDRRYEHVPSVWRRAPFARPGGLLQRGLLWRHAHRQIDRVVESGFCAGADGVLAVLDSPTAILMARALATRIDVPLRTLVWDAPEWLVRRDRLLPPVARTVLREFDRCMRAAVACGVMCEQAASDYARRYQIRSTVVRHGVPDDWFGGLGAPGGDGLEEFRIGFCGSMTAPDAFDAFLAALDQMGWTLSGRPVRLVLLGGHFSFSADTARCVEWLGHLPGEEDVIRRLRSCDLLYLPQPFDPERHSVATFSFPAKMSVYLAAGRPVFSHGIPESSVAGFLAETSAGWHCASLRHDEIARMLAECGDALSRSSSIERPVQAAFFNKASLSLMKSRLAQLLQGDGGCGSD